MNFLYRFVKNEPVYAQYPHIRMNTTLRIRKITSRSAGLLIVALAAFRATAQSVSVKDSLLFRKNHFSAQLDAGAHSTVYEQTSGTKHPQHFPGLHARLNLGYTFNINPSFGILTEVGAGCHMLHFSTSDIAINTFQATGSVAASFVYRLPLDNRQFLQFRAGPGLSSYGGAWTTDFFEIYDPATDNWQSGKVDLQYHLIQPYVGFGAGMSRILPNCDLLSLNLLWEQSFASAYTGNFMLTNGTAAGTLRNGRSTVSLGLSYQFTHMRDQIAVERIRKRDSLSPREAGIVLKKEKRYLHPNSIFVGASGGFFLTANRITKGEDGPFGNYTSAASSFRLFAEKGFGNNYFAEAGLGFAQYTSVLHLKEFDVTNIYYIYPATQLSAGVGKRLIGKNNLRIIDISAGVALNFQWWRKDLPTTFTGTVYNGTEEYLRSFFPTCYAGLSKDIRISDRFLLNLAYRYQLGLVPVSEIRMTYELNNEPPIETVVTIKGTGHYFQFGLKYRLSRRTVRMADTLLPEH